MTPNIKRLIESCANVEYLTINDCELESLENFPKLQNLVVLEMTDNQYLCHDIDLLVKTSTNWPHRHSSNFSQLSTIKSHPWPACTTSKLCHSWKFWRSTPTRYAGRKITETAYFSCCLAWMWSTASIGKDAWSRSKVLLSIFQVLVIRGWTCSTCYKTTTKNKAVKIWWRQLPATSKMEPSLEDTRLKLQYRPILPLSSLSKGPASIRIASCSWELQ